jgi:hypothetical protein
LVTERCDHDIARTDLVLSKRLEMLVGDVSLLVSECPFPDVLKSNDARPVRDVVRRLEIRSERTIDKRCNVADRRVCPPRRQLI